MQSCSAHFAAASMSRKCASVTIRMAAAESIPQSMSVKNVVRYAKKNRLGSRKIEIIKGSNRTMHTRKIGGEFCEYEVWVTDFMMIRFGKYIEKDKNFYID